MENTQIATMYSDVDSSTSEFCNTDDTDASIILTRYSRDNNGESFSYIAKGSDMPYSYLEFLNNSPLKEELYQKALKNLFKKIDFFSLNWQLENEQISEEEFNKELNEKEKNYLIEISDAKIDKKTLLLVDNIVKKLDREMSIDDVSELFSIDLSDSDNIINSI